MNKNTVAAIRVKGCEPSLPPGSTCHLRMAGCYAEDSSSVNRQNAKRLFPRVVYVWSFAIVRIVERSEHNEDRHRGSFSLGHVARSRNPIPLQDSPLR